MLPNPARPVLPLLLLLAACQGAGPLATAPTGRDGAGLRPPVGDGPGAWERLIMPDTATTLGGPSDVGTGFGSAVSGDGDVNGDNFSDVAVGAPEDGGGVGAVYLYFGSATGTSTTADVVLPGGEAGAGFGSHVSFLGDINQDGFMDMAVAAPASGRGTGRVYVYYGSPTGPAVRPEVVLSGEAEGDEFGFGVGRAGDLNADRFPDVVIGAPGANASAGRVYIYPGGPKIVAEPATITLDGSDTEEFGRAITGAGDIDRDGYDDLVVGASAWQSETGRAYIFAGSATGPATTASASIDGEAAGDRFGATLGKPHDVDVDLQSDMLIGATGHNAGAGRVYLYKGSATGLVTPAAWTMDGSAGGVAGAGLAGLGDCDVDYHPDVVIGEPGYYEGVGRILVYGGDGVSLEATPGVEIDGGGRGYGFGSGLAGAGDVNSDGAMDLVVSAPGAASGLGGAWVYYGTPIDLDGDGAGTGIDCDDNDPGRFPGNTEVADDGIDQDCDNQEICFSDMDADGYRDVGSRSTDLTCSGDGMVDSGTPGGDCNDEDAAINPGADDPTADGVDQDCDGVDGPQVDTGDSGDSGDTSDSGDTDTTDTADSADSGDTGAGDTAATGDEDKGGCGCATSPPGAAAAAWALGLGALAVRRRKGVAS